MARKKRFFGGAFSRFRGTTDETNDIERVLL